MTAPRRLDRKPLLRRSPPFHANLLWSIGNSDQRSGEFRVFPNVAAGPANTAYETGRMYAPTGDGTEQLVLRSKCRRNVDSRFQFDHGADQRRHLDHRPCRRRAGSESGGGVQRAPRSQHGARQRPSPSPTPGTRRPWRLRRPAPGRDFSTTSSNSRAIEAGPRGARDPAARRAPRRRHGSGADDPGS